MKYILISIIVLSLVAVSCQTDDEPETVQELIQERQQKEAQKAANEVEEDLVKAPPVTLDEVEEGSCVEAALKFATALTEADSATMMAYSTDTIHYLVRAMFMNEPMIEQIKQQKQMGFAIKSASKVTNQGSDTECRVCITAAFRGDEDQDCSFYVIKSNGQWKVNNFGSPANQ